MGSGGEGGGQAGAAASQQADIARELMSQTSLLRRSLFGDPGTPAVAARPQQFIPGSGDSGMDQFIPGIAGSPAVPGSPGLLQDLLAGPNAIPAERDTLESQFSRARESIISGGPSRGGLQASLLAQNEAERAGAVARLSSLDEMRRQENIFRTSGLVTGQNQLSLGGLGSAAGTFSGLAGQQAALAGQLGQAAGLYGGLKAAGPATAGKTASASLGGVPAGAAALLI